MVQLDMRDMYLKDIHLIAATYPLGDIAQAQQDFQTKTHIGKFVLIP